MMAANLVGFAVGVDGMVVMVSKIVQPEGMCTHSLCDFFSIRPAFNL